MPSFTVANYNLFSNFGEGGKLFLMAASEDQAVDGILSSEWAAYSEEAQGCLTEWLSINHPKRYQGEWNTKIKAIRSLIESVVDKRLLPRFSGPSTSLRDALIWDLMICEMDGFYDDLENRPIMSKRVREVYEAGYLACGVTSDGHIIAY